MIIGLDYAKQLPAKENLALLGQVVEILGNEVRRDGQETVTLKDGTVRVDRTSYPVVYNPKLNQRIILDPDEKIPVALKSKLTDPSAQTGVLPITGTASLQESVSRWPAWWRSVIVTSPHAPPSAYTAATTSRIS